MALKKLFIKDCRLTSASGDTVDQRRNYLVKTSDYTDLHQPLEMLYTLYVIEVTT